MVPALRGLQELGQKKTVSLVPAYQSLHMHQVAHSERLMLDAKHVRVINLLSSNSFKQYIATIRIPPRLSGVTAVSAPASAGVKTVPSEPICG